tara:strand:+ start:1697 stop:2227 length:531 start_codon:yes stop_codon:yes gene_type:complete
MHYWLLNKYYFINSLDTNIKKKIPKDTIIIYRNYDSKKVNLSKLLKLKKYLKKRKIKFFLSNNIKLAIKLRLDGAYIPSFNKDFGHLSYTFNSTFVLIGSAHSLEEIRIKELQKVKTIFISSIFKPNKNFLGLNKFKIISNYTKKKVVALGGISKKNINKLSMLNISGFAGISFFG